MTICVSNGGVGFRCGPWAIRSLASALPALRASVAVAITLYAGPLAWCADSSAGQTTRVRCFALELYVRSGDAECRAAAKVVADFAKTRRGVGVRTFDLDKDAGAADRLERIAKYFRIDKPAVPVVYGCNEPIVGSGNVETLRGRLRSMLRMNAFVRAGCPRCAQAKQYLQVLQERYPGLDVSIRDIVAEQSANEELQRLAQKYGTAAVSVPVFHVCNQLIVGFDSPSTTGQRLEAALSAWTYDCRSQPAQTSTEKSRPPEPSWKPRPPRNLERRAGNLAPARPTWLVSALVAQPLSPPKRQPTDEPREPLPLPLPPLSPPSDAATDGAAGLEPPANGELPLPSANVPPPPDAVELPVFGRLSARQVGLPAFTLAIGLVDGFNPCAMWVLLFLLSVLVNLRDRLRILAVAGTFVLISGLAYFAFMAAWLNVLLFVGLLRGVQVTLALLAIGVGSIHIKDFFAFKRGITLSIPESAKPGLYARVRRIVTAENLWGAILGAGVLAVLVNLIELLCTAGLPALYTQVLSMQQLPSWMNYLYLGLYLVAYMFDDSVMVALVVLTLGRRKLQETHGRWLKLVSGTAIVVLGLVMLLKPELLV